MKNTGLPKRKVLYLNGIAKPIPTRLDSCVFFSSHGEKEKGGRALLLLRAERDAVENRTDSFKLGEKHFRNEWERTIAVRFLRAVLQSSIPKEKAKKSKTRRVLMRFSFVIYNHFEGFFYLFGCHSRWLFFSLFSFSTEVCLHSNFSIEQ